MSISKISKSAKLAAEFSDSTAAATTATPVIQTKEVHDDQFQFSELMTTLFGTSGDDSMVANAADLEMVGLEGNDTILGTTFSTVIFGSKGNDYIAGSTQADLLIGGEGNDTVLGLGGDDTVNTDAGNDSLDGGEGGHDLLNAYSATEAVKINMLLNTMIGGASVGSDTITNFEVAIGSQFNDFIIGDDKANELQGKEGDDTINGAAGRDSIFGGSGNNKLEGGDGADFISDEAGNSFINGGQGLDTIDAGDGNDTIYGGENNDTIIAGAGNDSIHGGDGADVIFGVSGNNIIRGGFEKDYIYGGSDSDTIFGDQSVDVLNGGLGRDVLTGGRDQDFFMFDSALGGNNIDLITDFTKQDHIILANDVFTNLTTGSATQQAGFVERVSLFPGHPVSATKTLAESAFKVISNGNFGNVDANDKVIFDKSNGNMYYDADGSGSALAVQFATVTTDHTLTASDVWVLWS